MEKKQNCNDEINTNFDLNSNFNPNVVIFRFIKYKRQYHKHKKDNYNGKRLLLIVKERMAGIM